MRWIAAVVFSMLSSSSVQAAAPGGPARLVVLDLVAERGIDPGVVRLLDELLLTEFQRTKKYLVFGGSDLRAILSEERQRDLVGCTESTCLTELSGALGAELLAAGTLGRVGDHYLLNAKIVNTATATVEARWSTQVDAIEDRLIAAVHESVAALTGIDTAPAAAPSVLRFAPASLWVLGGAGLVAGGVLGAVAAVQHSRAQDPEYVGAQVEAQRGARNQTLAITFAAVGGVLALGGAGWWLWGPHSPRAVVTPVAAGNSVGFVVGATF